LLLDWYPIPSTLELSLINLISVGEAFEETDSNAELLYSTPVFAETVPMIFDYLIFKAVVIVLAESKKYLTNFTYNVLRLSSKINEKPLE